MKLMFKITEADGQLIHTYKIFCNKYNTAVRIYEGAVRLYLN